MYRVDFYLLVENSIGHLVLGADVRANNVEEARRKVTLDSDQQRFVVEGDNQILEAPSSKVVAVHVYEKNDKPQRTF